MIDKGQHNNSCSKKSQGIVVMLRSVSINWRRCLLKQEHEIADYVTDKTVDSGTQVREAPLFLEMPGQTSLGPLMT